MTSDILPLFSTASSLKQGGIFTVEKAGAAQKVGKKRGPVSLCDLAKAENLKKLYLVEDRFGGFMTAYKNLAEVGCQLVFGLKLVICDDINDKSDTSFKNESKVIIFMAKDGSTDYQALIDIASKAFQDGFYYIPRLDWKTLCSMWSNDLILALPFYSSFLAVNTLTFASIVPQLPSKPVLLSENNEMPFDDLLGDSVVRYAAANEIVPQAAKSIYYKNRSDAKKFLIWRAALDRKTWDKPNFDHLVSREFCWESYKEAIT